MGGTLARLSARGHHVRSVICSIPSEPARRIEEAQTAASILGIESKMLEFGRTTWQVEDILQYELVAAIDSEIRAFRPASIFTHWVNDAHLDHVLVAKATLASSRYSACDVFMCDQPNSSAANPELLNANVYFDVSDFMDVAFRAIGAHVSQVSGTRHVERKAASVAYWGARVGLDAAEAFQCARQVLEW